MSIRAMSNVFLAALFASTLNAPALGYTKHVRLFAPNQEGETNTQKLAFVMEKSIGNPENLKRFYVDKIELSVAVDPTTDEIDPKLLAREDSVELSFVANDFYWSIEPKSCVPQEGLRNKTWLYCAVNDDKTGFVIETKPGGAGVILHFGKLWQASSSAIPALITYGESPDFLVTEKDESARNRLVIADDRTDLISIELVDARSEE